MAKPKLIATQWFDGKLYEPGQNGVFERQIPNIDFRTFSYWDGKIWYSHSLTPEKAVHNLSESSCQNVPWRGFETQPSKKDKKFVVFD